MANAGKISFKLSDDELRKAIDKFRAEYGSGAHGMVTWPRFCSYLGYSVDEVRECYERGRSGVNAYNVRAVLLERFHSECRALTVETSHKQQALARSVISINYLAPEGEEKTIPTYIIKFAAEDSRSMEACK